MVKNVIYTQGSAKQQDSIKVIKATKILPAKIKSVDGAIIPKEAVAWTELRPSKPLEKEKESTIPIYFLAIVVVTGLIIFVRKFYKKSKKHSA